LPFGDENGLFLRVQILTPARSLRFFREGIAVSGKDVPKRCQSGCPRDLKEIFCVGVRRHPNAERRISAAVYNYVSDRLRSDPPRYLSPHSAHLREDILGLRYQPPHDLSCGQDFADAPALWPKS